MLSNTNIKKPIQSETIATDAEAMGFEFSCDLETASLLRTLVGAFKKGKFLEVGTGAGYSTSWILDGMDQESSLLTVELDEKIQSIAKRHLSLDHRVQFFTMDGEDFIRDQKEANQEFDFIFADTWGPGKYYVVDETLELLKSGGIYVIDDLIPLQTWPEEHTNKVKNVVSYLDSREDLIVTKLFWSTGIIMATKK